MHASDFYSPEEKQRIVQAIREAELLTSGEIRVHLEISYTGELLDRAATVFARLKMHKTELRNGVLFYIAIKERHFAIIGDAGINRLVPPNFWAEIKSVMETYFKNLLFAGGLIRGISMAGVQLKKHFPYPPNDKNELPNDISFEPEPES